MPDETKDARERPRSDARDSRSAFAPELDILVIGMSHPGANMTSVSLQVSDPNGPGLAVLNVVVPSDRLEGLKVGTSFEASLATRAGRKVVGDDVAGELDGRVRTAQQDPSAFGSAERNKHAADAHLEREKVAADERKATQDLLDKQAAERDKRAAETARR